MATGYPKLNTIILGASGGLMLASSLTGFIGYGGLGGDSTMEGTKNLLLGASLMSLLSALLLGVGIFLIHRHARKMEAAFKGFFSFTLLILAGLFMLISGILYAAAAVKLSGDDGTGKKYKDTYGTSYATAVVAAVMTLGGLGAVGISFLTALFAMRKKKSALQRVVTTSVQQQPSYQDDDGAAKQLRELQHGTGTVPGTM